MLEHFVTELGRMSPFEYAAAALGVANIVLIARRNVWNYAFGIPMVTLYAYVFYEAKLYADALLQIYFLIMQFYGLWYWMQGRAGDGLIRVETLTLQGRLVTAAITLLAALAIGYLFSTYTDAALPWLEAPIPAMSIVAQYLMSKRKIENWILWIAVDLVAIVIFPMRGLYVTTALYALFLVVSAAGLVQWQRQLRREAFA